MVAIHKCIHIQAPVGEVYRYWERFEDFPSFVRSVESVERLDEERSRWVIRAPFNTRVEFETETIEKKENELIRWRSVHGKVPAAGTLESMGEVRFEEEKGGDSSVVHLKVQYDLPNRVAQSIAEALHTFGFPDREVEKGLNDVKKCIEIRCAA